MLDREPLAREPVMPQQANRVVDRTNRWLTVVIGCSLACFGGLILFDNRQTIRDGFRWNPHDAAEKQVRTRLAGGGPPWPMGYDASEAERQMREVREALRNDRLLTGTPVTGLGKSSRGKSSPPKRTRYGPANDGRTGSVPKGW
jgi:hypothetical protein